MSEEGIWREVEVVVVVVVVVEEEEEAELPGNSCCVYASSPRPVKASPTC